MNQINFKNYRVRVEFDDDSASRGWDGDVPLDPEREWTPYVLFFEGQCENCDSWHDIDCIGGVWASDDADGRDYIYSCASDYFEVPGSLTMDDVEFEGMP